MERPTDSATFTATDQIFPSGLQASTKCFASPSIPSYQSMIAPPCWKIGLLRRTGQSCTSLTPLCPPTTPCALVLSRHAQRPRSFSMPSRPGAVLLGVEADELEGLLAQAACHAPPSLGEVAFDQLVTAAILAKGDKKPLSTFIGQIIMNASQKDSEATQHPSPFFYCVSEPLDSPALYSRLQSPHFPRTLALTNKVHRPLNIFSIGLGALASTVVGLETGEPTAHTPRGTPEHRSQPPSSPHYQRECVSQVKFVKHGTADRVLIDNGASIHLSGSLQFTTVMRDIPPFRIFFADSNSSVTISQTTALKILVNNGFVIIRNVPFSKEISGTILSVGRLCRAGVVPLSDGLSLSLLLSNVLVTTTFVNGCWWLDVVHGGETNRSAAVSSPPCLLEMNLISLPTSVSLSPRGWHNRLGHACNKFVISLLKQHVPSFDVKIWQSFYCKVCAKAKSTHGIAKARTNIPKDKPLNLLVSDIMGPFMDDAQGFQYLLTIRDHVSTYSIVYSLKSRLEAPEAILDAVTQLQVRLGATPKALRTDNAREFTSASFTSALTKLGVAFCPFLPCLPQENGKAEHLNQRLGDMARVMMVQSEMPEQFWKFAYSLAAFLHHRLPNS
ncbi:hypothetical protein O181_066673 [Austropuccinia psidii MF-1]|uniref:Integrase catalytic domain-containing protein n=1 Tax=Austropuccinia psidii MF-1 TaxID=1389203 RepID=A0A9Q3I3T8_9BASI|nr:hypothetical protein [Austropuccinia psidii MF-1]